MLASADRSFASLLKRARSGDDDAIGDLLEGYDGYLKRIAVPMIRSVPPASVGLSDVVQEAKFRAYAGFASFLGGSEP